MDFSQYTNLIDGFVTILFALLGVDAILKVVSLERTFGDLFIRIGIIVMAVCLGYGIVIRAI